MERSIKPHPSLIEVSCGAGSTRCAAPSVANTNRLMQSAGVSARRLSWFQCRSIAGVAEDGSPAAPIAARSLIPLWLGFGLGHAPRGPGAAGKESHHPGPAPRRGSPLMTRSRCRRRLASAGSPSKWSSSAMTIIPTGGTGARARWARGRKTHRDRDCNGCRARRPAVLRKNSRGDAFQAVVVV